MDVAVGAGQFLQADALGVVGVDGVEVFDLEPDDAHLGLGGKLEVAGLGAGLILTCYGLGLVVFWGLLLGCVLHGLYLSGAVLT